MMSEPSGKLDELLQPSSSSLATSIAAAYNIIRPQRMVGPIMGPDGVAAEKAKKWAELVGECARIIHVKVSEQAPDPAPGG